MKYIDVTFPTPAMNLACDEALLDFCEEGREDEILRFWEPVPMFVVVGYSNSVEREVHSAVCRKDGTPILRRYSGGGAVLQGHGCMNYSLILRIENSEYFGTIAGTNSYIMSTHKEALQLLLGTAIEVEGHSDLTLRGKKFSGNAQRRREKLILFHGTFLLWFNIPMMGKYLRMPSKKPGYRHNRSHAEFLTNINVRSSAVKQALRDAWGATEILDFLPVERIEELARTRYETNEWNFKR